MYYEWLQQNKKRLVIGIAGFIMLLSAWGVWVYASHNGKVPVTVSTVPGDSSISLNGQPSSAGTIWLTPGIYKFKSQKDGFVTREKTVTVTDDKKQNVVALALTPQSDEAKKWASDHASDYTSNETFGSIEAQSNGAYFEQKNPIVSHLPYNDPYFQINYTANNDNTISLFIGTPSPRYRYFAIQKIREFGFDPADFKITFTDFKNPLGEKK